MSYENPAQTLEETLNEVWRAIKDTLKKYRQKDKKIIFNDDFIKFRNGFTNRYNKIMTDYMKDDVRELDRHKIVAIMIVVCIEDEIITYSAKQDKMVSLAPYAIAVEVGLNWMYMGLKSELDKAGCSHTIQEYYMPAAFTCPTSYFNIFCRNLYYANMYWSGLNPLDIAERLYLLEYITLQKNYVSPDVLKNYDINHRKNSQ